MSKCKICNFEFKQLGKHIIRSHHLSLQMYYDTYLKKENEDICVICGNIINFGRDLVEAYKNGYCSNECAMKSPTRLHNALSTRKKNKRDRLLLIGIDIDNLPLCMCNCGKKVKHYTHKYINGHGFSGKHLSEESKKKISDARRGKKPSIQAINAAIKINTGSKHSEEHKLKISKSLKSEECQNKCKVKYFEKYGVYNLSSSPEIKKKIRKTKEVNGTWIPIHLHTSLEIYRLKVYYFTNISMIKKYSIEELIKRGPAGTDTGHHIDHKFSVNEGFKNNILPCIIGSQSNIELIPWLENNKKYSKCSIEKDELFRLYDLELITI